MCAPKSGATGPSILIALLWLASPSPAEGQPASDDRHQRFSIGFEPAGFAPAGALAREGAKPGLDARVQAGYQFLPGIQAWLALGLAPAMGFRDRWEGGYLHRRSATQLELQGGLRWLRPLTGPLSLSSSLGASYNSFYPSLSIESGSGGFIDSYDTLYRGPGLRLGIGPALNLTPWLRIGLEISFNWSLLRHQKGATAYSDDIFGSALQMSRWRLALPVELVF